MILLCMKFKEFIKQCQRIIEVKDCKDYKYSCMAEIIGVSERTYGEYIRGMISPLAAKALLNLLSRMDDEDIIKMIRRWEKGLEV